VKPSLAVLPARAYTVLEPLGVALIIAPWNYPVQLLLAPMVGALAAGNAVVVKPSEIAAHTSSLLADLIPKYLDPRAVVVVEGGVPETTELLEQRFDHIFYTGNGMVGRIVMTAAAQHLTPVTLELGGKSPVFVDDTQDIDLVAARIAWGKFVNAGQTCVAPDYVLATPSVARDLAHAIARVVERMYGPDPKSSQDYGRIINERQFDRLSAYLGSENGETITGGQVSREDLYIAPTVLFGTSPDAPVMQEEIFGPILPIVTVRDAAEAISYVRGGDKPLALYVFSDRREVRRAFLRDTSSGALTFGLPVAHLAIPDLPFGGVGESGMGSYHGKRSIEVFSHEKSVVSKPLAPDTMALIYPPFEEGKSTILRKLL
jgi:aldehyde dehydrogenase (NAD+)